MLREPKVEYYSKLLGTTLKPVCSPFRYYVIIIISAGKQNNNNSYKNPSHKLFNLITGLIRLY